MLRRLCNLPNSLPFFLFGPRQTGKTTLITSHLESLPHWKVDLLDQALYFRYVADPGMFYREAKEAITTKNISIVFIDEIQKIPALLNEVQRLIQEFGVLCIMTGSSARKLRRNGSNLLGGRAVEKNIFPLTWLELGEGCALSDILTYGALPGIILNANNEEKVALLNAYISVYLAEEIQQEALVRNIPGFVQFLEVAAQQSGELINFSHVARDAHLQPRTVQTYYDILVDTLTGIRLPAWYKSVRRRLRVTPKFYLFDTGVLNAIERQLRSIPDTNRFGRLFEHFIVLETYRLVKYLSPDGRIFFWRTKDGQEVDILIENRGTLVAAVEVKSAKKVTTEYLSGLHAFHSEYPSVRRFVVSRVPEPYEIDDIKILPWEKYLRALPELLHENVQESL